MSIRSQPTAPTTLNQTNANLILSHTISSAARLLAPLALVEAYSKTIASPETFSYDAAARAFRYGNLWVQ